MLFVDVTCVMSGLCPVWPEGAVPGNLRSRKGPDMDCPIRLYQNYLDHVIDPIEGLSATSMGRVAHAVGTYRVQSEGVEVI